MEKYLPLNKILTKYCTIILLLVALFSSSLSYAQCPTGGNIAFYNQTDIDNFSTDYPGCTVITGWVYISESVAGNITNLNGLSAITSIGVSLYIINNTALTSFSGLDNLTSTGTYLTCINNDALTSFSGLEKVASIGGQLNINGNDALASISGLNTLASIGGDLTISNNPMLTSLTGLDNINPGTIPNLILQNNSLLSSCEVASICSYLNVPANPATISGNVACACNSRSEIESACTPSCPPGGSITLTTQADIDNFSCNFVGCTALTGNLTIDESVAGNITNLNGLTALTSVGGSLTITTNSALTNLTGLDNITYVGGGLTININTMLSSLSGLDNLASVGGIIYIENNSSVSSLSALSQLTSINGILLVNNCPALTNLSGLDNIASIAGYLRIQNNGSLANLSGLANVTSIGGYLTIDNNDALTSLSGLDGITSIAGVLTISNNAMIISLSSLDNIAPAGISNLILQNNSLLSTCEVASICSYLGVPANTATITGNATGCSSRVEVENACLSENYTAIPDANFEQKLIALGIDTDGITGWVLTADAEAQTGTLELSYSSISDLTGIEAFINITKLHLYSNLLTNLSLSQNTALTHLYCGANQLSSLDVSQNTALTHLNCEANNLPSLDVSQNTALTYLDCAGPYLSSLDVSQNTALTRLELNGGNVNSLDVSQNTALTYLNCSSNVLYSLDVSQNTALTHLSCSYTYLTSLDVRNGNNTNFTTFDLSPYNNSLTCISVDDPTYSTANWTDVPAGVVFSPGCGAYTAIPDANFEQKLITLGIDTDGITGWVLTTDVNELTSLDVSSSNISDLTGIEAFVSLTHLHCHGNQLTSLDISQNTALTLLYCYDNQLTSLDISQNTALYDLRCNLNQLSSLDVSQNTALTILLCDSNQLSSLDVSQNTALGIFYCYANQLTSLDLSQNTALTSLHCHSNQLSSLDVSQNTALGIFYCYANQLTSLDLSQNTALMYLSCYLNQLTSLDLSLNTALVQLYCNSNQLTSLDVRNGNNTNFTNFNATNNSLTCILVDDPTYSTANWTNVDAEVIFALDCNRTLIPDANFEQKLIDLGIDTHGGPTNGWILTADVNELTSLDVSSSNIFDLTGIEAFVSLTHLHCHGNQLTSLDISQNTALTLLYCYNNQLTSLDLSQNTALYDLRCNLNQLSNLDLSQNTALTILLCDSNQLSSLDVSQNTALVIFYCYANQLTSLDISQNTALTNLLCNSNQLSSLDLSHNTALTYLNCFSNLLTSLDLRNGNNTNFTYFDATNNSLTCISVDDPTYSTANWTSVDAGVIFEFNCGYTAIPDANFEQKLIDLGIDTEGGPTDGWILTADAEAKTGALDVSSSNISDLTGIEAFINIVHLNCHSNQLTSLDVSQNIALHTLYCQSNQLSSLDVSQNTALLYFICSSNQLSSLDVSLNTVLKDLRCNSNQLTSLDVSLNTVLIKLGCNSNQLTELDVRNGNNTNFTYFNATNNSLTCISVDDPTYSTANWTNVDAAVLFSSDCDSYTAIPDANFEQKLIDLGIDSEAGPTDGWILTADAEAKTGALDVSNSSISDLTGIEAFINITQLYCYSNQLTSLDLSQNTALTILTCYSNQLVNLDVSQNTALKHLTCNSNQLAGLDVTQNTALNDLRCQGNQLTSLDVSHNTALTYLNCHTNQLSSLDVSHNTALIRFFCESNQLTSLDVRNGYNTNFIFFYAYSNSLTCISVDDPNYSTANWTNIDAGVVFSPGCDSYTAIPDANFEQKLIDLGIDSEGGSTDGWILTADAEAKTGALDVSNSSISDLTGIEAFINITQLYCYSNQLTSLDLSQNTALNILHCNSNQLVGLDVTQNTALTYLRCNSNQLAGLDVTQNTALNDLRCQGNQLTSLDVSLNTALVGLFCNSNQLTSLDVSNNPVLKDLWCQSNQLSELDVRNGNNTNFNLFDATNNSLTCISVDDPAYSTANWTSVDAGVVFSPGCGFYTAIPDTNFEQELIAQGKDTDGITGWILNSSVANLTNLSIGNSNISDLTGIEAFTSLTVLNCHSNMLTSLDLSQNTALMILFCYGNQLTSLDLSLHTALTHLRCYSNLLTSLNVQNTALTYLDCQANYLSSLDVSLTTTLASLRCNSNQLTSLDVSQNTALVQLICNWNQLTSLDVRNGNNTNFNVFNATNNNSLTCISVDDPAYSTANWTNVDAGTYFSFSCLCPDPSWTVPAATSSSITSNASCTDVSGWTHYFNSSSDELLLSLEIGTSGAVIPENVVTLDPDGATDVFWVDGVSGNFINNPDGAAFMKRKWDVTPTTQPSNSVGVRFYYTTDEYNAVNTEISNQGGTALTDHTQMRFFKVLNSSNPFNVGSLLENDGIDLEHGTASTTQWSYSTFGSDHYSEFYVDGFSGGGGGGASGGGALLPIELIYFRGEALDQSNLITWATASEENTELHLIEYSNGIDDWKVIGQREAAGFSSQTIYYEFSDHSPSTIGYYRLKSVDFDGAFQVSNTIAIERESDHFELLNVYPIPTESNLGINFNLANKSLITVTLTDLSGRMVTVQRHDGTAGVNRINLDLSQLNAGMYLVQIDNGREKLQRRIVKQ